MTFHSGKIGTATIGGTEVPLIDWDVQPSAQIVDFKNSKTGSFPYRESTFKDASVSFSIDFDYDANPFSTLSLTPGAALATVKLYLNGTSGLYWNFPSLVISGTPQQLSVEGKLVTKVNCVINGTYAMPGGVTP